MTESGNQSAYALAANATPFGHLMSAPGPASYEAREHTAVGTKGPSDYEAYYGPAPPGVLNADVMGQIARTNLQLPAYYQVRPRSKTLVYIRQHSLAPVPIHTCAFAGPFAGVCANIRWPPFQYTLVHLLTYAPTFAGPRSNTHLCICWRMRQHTLVGLGRARTFTWSASSRGVLPTLMTVSGLDFTRVVLTV